MPAITVITAVFNGGKVLEKAIQSVLHQTYPNIEYIIIDGGSKDETVSIIQKYQHRLHYWVSEKDTGVYNAWNKGLAKATGEWISFLGADDAFESATIIEESVKDLDLAIRQGIRYVYGKVNLLNGSNNELITVMGEPWEEAKKRIFQYMTVTHCGAFHHKDLFNDYGTFDESFKITGDYEFILREFARGKEALFINKSLVNMHDGGLSANMKLKLTVARENIRALALNGLPITKHQKLQLYKAKIIALKIKLLGENTVKKLRNTYKKTRRRK